MIGHVFLIAAALVSAPKDRSHDISHAGVYVITGQRAIETCQATSADWCDGFLSGLDGGANSRYYENRKCPPPARMVRTMRDELASFLIGHPEYRERPASDALRVIEDGHYICPHT